jgi:hypothetical protein
MAVWRSDTVSFQDHRVFFSVPSAVATRGQHRTPWVIELARSAPIAAVRYTFQTGHESPIPPRAPVESDQASCCYRVKLAQPCAFHPGSGGLARVRVHVTARMAGGPPAVAAVRRDRPAPRAASSTLAWTEKTSISRVRVSSRSTCCCGAASSSGAAR